MPRAAAAKKESPIEVAPRVAAIRVDVDWTKVPMPEAQQLYSQLKSEFEKAGQILNARSMPQQKGYVCFMAGREKCCPAGVVHDGDPRGTDYSYKDPKTGLMVPVRICSENCWIRYQNMLIEERRKRLQPEING